MITREPTGTMIVRGREVLRLHPARPPHQGGVVSDDLGVVDLAEEAAA